MLFLSCMAYYVTDEAKLRQKIFRETERAEAREMKREFVKRREHMRRRIQAALYEPRVCMGDPVTGLTCTKYAIPGAGFCANHGGTTKAMQEAARIRLLYLVEPSLRAVSKCLVSSDPNIVLKAAQILLDRAGFHPSATLEIRESDPIDLANLSTKELRKRAARLIDAIDQAPAEQGLLPDGMPEDKDDLDPSDPLNIIIDMENEDTEPGSSVH